MHILSPETNCPSWISGNDRRKYFIIYLHNRMLPERAGIGPANSWSPVRHASNRATEAARSRKNARHLGKMHIQTTSTSSNITECQHKRNAVQPNLWIILTVTGNVICSHLDHARRGRCNQTILLRQHTIKPETGLARPARTLIRLDECDVRPAQSSVSPRYPKRDKENPGHTGWMYMLILRLTGLTVGFVLRWLI